MRHLIVLWLAACGSTALPPNSLVYVRNAQGSVVGAVDESGTKVWEAHDDAYGLRLAGSGTPVPREFLDQPLDEETGFYVFHYRVYDPATAQWLQPDPRLQLDPGACAEQPQYCNPYSYAANRPGELIDPDGRWAQTNVTLRGELYTVFTVAVVDPDIERAKQAIAAAQSEIATLNATPGNQKILAFMRPFTDLQQVPASFDRVTFDPGNPEPSEAHREAGSISLRRDAATYSGLEGAIMVHELLHLAGAQDRYEKLSGEPRRTPPLPGMEHDLMATLAGQQIGDADRRAMTDSQQRGANNQGLTAPPPEEWPVPTDPKSTSAMPASVSSP